jgi:autophagy-related protein 5
MNQLPSWLLSVILWLGRVPVRLYVRSVQEDLYDLEDALPVGDWESISYINRPFEVRREEGM